MFAFIFIVFLFVVYLYYTKNFGYWSNRGVKHDKPVIFFGTNAKNFLMQQSRSQAMEEMYWKYPSEKVVGFFRSAKPELILRDPDIIKKVLITNFSNFHMRGFHPNRNAIEPVMRMVAFVEGDRWKMLRQVMSPAFTGAKIKAMFPLVIELMEKLQQRTLKAKSDVPIDARDLISRFTLDFIGRCEFGIDAKTLEEDDNDFKRIGCDIINTGIEEFVVTALKEMFPILCKNLKYYGRVEKRLLNLVKQVKKSRDYKPCGKNDVIDQLLTYGLERSIVFDSIENIHSDGTPQTVRMKLDESLSDAQIIVLFIAGFGTTSLSTSYTLHQLAFNPEAQVKAQKEIDEVLAKNDNKLSFEALKELTYLDGAFKEAMRLFPALGNISRECTGKYTFPDIDLTIDAGVRMIVPVTALHMDPKYWDEPKEFRPERFHTDNFTAVQKSAYFAFGEGPRSCLGARLGQTAALAGLVAILSRFTVEPAPNSIRYPSIDPIADIVQSPKGRKLPLIFKERR